MCGRYALALPPSSVRQMLEQDDMPVFDSPDDNDDNGPRSTYNFAPGYSGLVYRANLPPSHTSSQPGPNSLGSRCGDDGDRNVLSHNADEPESHTQYKLQSMKWGLIPSWTKRSPNYTSMLKTINCRDDSLATSGGLWSTMKARKRCIVLAQGFFEWLQVGPKTKVPHFVKRKDGRLMCLAGLWDCVKYDDSTSHVYTYTIITTDSNKQLKFLHTRMPVILEPATEAMWNWLDPERNSWSRELQAILRPYTGELEVYPVHQDVGKVGNSSPVFIRPLDDHRNRSNIANFFNKGKDHSLKRPLEQEEPSPTEIEVADVRVAAHANPSVSSTSNKKPKTVNKKQNVSSASKITAFFNRS